MRVIVEWSVIIEISGKLSGESFRPDGIWFDGFEVGNPDENSLSQNIIDMLAETRQNFHNELLAEAKAVAHDNGETNDANDLDEG